MIEELKRFLKVAQQGNVTKSAEKLYITQSALTQSLHRLEKQLQTKLFTQQGKQLRLTDDGKSLVIIGEKILQLWSNAHNPEIRKTKTPIYTIGMYDNAALRLGKFFQKNKKTDTYQLEVKIDASGKLLTQLQLGTLDAAICVINNTYTLPKHLQLIKTFSEELLPVSSQIFNESPEKIPFILYNQGSHTRAQIEKVFMEQGIQPTIFAESTSVTFMKELAILGCGVALLPDNFVQSDLERGILKEHRFPMRWKREYGLVIQKQYDIYTPFVQDILASL